MKAFDISALLRRLRENKFVLLIALLGLILLLLPSGRQRGDESTLTPSSTAFASASAEGKGDPLAASGIPLDTESERLQALLTEIAGVGEARVLLSQSGAVVVCAGAEKASVRLEVTNAVSAYTGLRSDQIRVIKMK